MTTPRASALSTQLAGLVASVGLSLALQVRLGLGGLYAISRRQTICVVQIVGLLLVVSPIVAPPGSAVVAAAALVTLSLSFFVDTLWLWRRAHGAPAVFSREAAKGTKPLVS